jgi:lipoic acid synthetase
MPLPTWLKKPIPKAQELSRLKALCAEKKLHTVCESAHCPNIGECFSQNTLTFLILGDHCTRHCKFCAVEKGQMLPPDADEPRRVAQTAKELNLSYVVVTSVTRDDLPDGGAEHFAQTIAEIKKAIPNVEVEVLIPDFSGQSNGEINQSALKIVLDAGPSVINHNIEMVSRLYPELRRQSNYQRSLNLLKFLKKEGKSAICTKSGFMLGLGETDAEVQSLLEDLKKAEVDLLTIGQYLPPSKAHYPVKEYVKPEKFAEYKDQALKMGFLQVESAPLVRSSYHARNLWKKH